MIGVCFVDERGCLGVHRLEGYAIVRETLIIFDRSVPPLCRFEQVLRGPDGRLYLYFPDGLTQYEFPYHSELHRGDARGPVSLEEILEDGYGLYDMAEFDH